MANVFSSAILPCSGGLAIRKKFNQLIFQRNVSCISAFQDQRYGRGLRLHTSRVKDGKPKGHRCTVCHCERGS